MKVLTYISCMDTAYVKESPSPKQPKIRFRKPSILGTERNSWYINRWLFEPQAPQYTRYFYYTNLRHVLAMNLGCCGRVHHSFLRLVASSWKSFSEYSQKKTCWLKIIRFTVYHPSTSECFYHLKKKQKNKSTGDLLIGKITIQHLIPSPSGGTGRSSTQAGTLRKALVKSHEKSPPGDLNHE